MAYDEDLANRLREALAELDGVSERAMFGGLAFLVDGNMTVVASRRGGVMARIDPDERAAALRRRHVSPIVMRGRETAGWIYVAGEGAATMRQLRPWVERSLRYVRTLPPKR